MFGKLKKETEHEEMKNIIKRTDGRWMGRKTINGKRITVYGRTQLECLKKWKAIKEQKQQSLYPTKLYDFAMYWFENYKKNEIDISSYGFYLNTIKNQLNIKMDIKNITTDNLQQLLNDLPPTRTKEKAFLTLRQVFRKAKELGIIKNNIAEYIVKGKIYRKEVPAFNLEEQTKIVSNLCDDETSIIILTYLLTGCRPNEIRTLRKSKIKNNMIYINGTKSDNAKRWVKISDRLIEILSRRSEILFKYSYDQISDRFDNYLAKIGVEGTLYQLRHTFATNLYYLGVPDKERQVYMGHYSSVLTNDVYTTFDPNITKNDIVKLYNNLYPEF